MIDDDVGEFGLIHILPIITINLKQMLHFIESIWQVLIVDYKQYPILSIILIHLGIVLAIHILMHLGMVSNWFGIDVLIQRV